MSVDSISRSGPTRLLVAIAAGGLVAGTLDILYAIVSLGMRGRSPQWVLQSVASGLLGSGAFDGGWASASLGLIAHFVIAIGAAAVFALAAFRFDVPQKHWIASGLLFGVGVYLVMNFVVLPLSAVPFKISYTWSVLAQGFVSHALLIGLPISAAVRRFALT